MSSFIPSTLRTRPDAPQASTDPSTSSSSSLALPAQVYTDCQSCRITGTLTFSAVGLYALTVSRATAKTPLGKGAASLMGLGAPHSPSRSSQRSERQLTPAFLLAQASSPSPPLAGTPTRRRRSTLSRPRRREPRARCAQGPCSLGRTRRASTICCVIGAEEGAVEQGWRTRRRRRRARRRALTSGRSAALARQAGDTEPRASRRSFLLVVVWYGPGRRARSLSLSAFPPCTSCLGSALGAHEQPLVERRSKRDPYDDACNYS